MYNFVINFQDVSEKSAKNHRGVYSFSFYILGPNDVTDLLSDNVSTKLLVDDIILVFVSQQVAQL